MEILRNGAVFEIDKLRYMVVGYDAMDTADGHAQLGYLTVPYPLGFMKMDDFEIVAASAEMEIISEGFGDDLSREAVPGLQEFAEGLRQADSRELRKLMKQLSAIDQEAER